MQNIAIALIAPFVLQLSAGDILRQQDKDRLEACILKLESNPSEAYEDGLAWQSEGNRPEARHCTALALIELGREEEGAARLEHLALATDGGTRFARAHYFFLAGNAWNLARRPEAAEVAFSEAIRLTPNDPDKYLGRARARLLQEQWSDAESDLTAALLHRAADIVSFQLRGEARLRLGDLDGALEDVQAALALDPENIESFLLRGRIREAVHLKDTVE